MEPVGLQLHKALASRDFDSVRRLIQEGTSVNEPYDEITPLEYAIIENVPLIAQLLIQHGADLSKKDDEDLVPLFQVCSRIDEDENYYEMCKVLLENGADCKVRDITESTPLLYAANWQTVEIVQLLLAHGADIAAVDNQGQTALHRAAICSDADMLEFLLDQRLDIECLDNFGQTPLHVAADNNNYEGCEFLLKHGAMVNRISNSNMERTQLMLALWHVGWHRGREARTVEVLLDHGADVTYAEDGERSVLKLGAWEDHRWLGGREDTQKVLMRHVVRMEYLNMNISEDDRQVIQNEDCYKRWYQTCLHEIESMKAEKFYDNVSVVSILMASDKVVSRYAKNEELVEALGKHDYDNQFPIYFTWLKIRFYAELKKQRLRKTAAKILSELFLFNEAFHPVIQTILYYLNDEDLEFLCSNFH